MRLTHSSTIASSASGVGSGALTCSLLRAVGPYGRVSSYERREEFAARDCDLLAISCDTVELHDVGGLRFNVWTSAVLFVVALAWFVLSARRWWPVSAMR